MEVLSWHEWWCIKYDYKFFVTPSSKLWCLFPLSLNLGCSCNLLWPTEYSGMMLGNFQTCVLEDTKLPTFAYLECSILEFVFLSSSLIETIEDPKWCPTTVHISWPVSQQSSGPFLPQRKASPTPEGKVCPVPYHVWAKFKALCFKYDNSTKEVLFSWLPTVAWPKMAQHSFLHRCHAFRIPFQEERPCGRDPSHLANSLQ